MNNEELNPHIKDRTFNFSLRVVKMVRSVPKDPAGYALASQVIRSGTSIGANIEEAQSAFSKKDFIHSMQIALKEARETFYWMRILTKSDILSMNKTSLLLKENEEIIKILTSIVKHAKVNNSE